MSQPNSSIEDRMSLASEIGDVGACRGILVSCKPKMRK